MRNGKPHKSNTGYTFIGLLMVLMLIGLTLAEAGNVWSQARQRDREQDLLKIGDTIRIAIQNYYNATPGEVKHYPRDLQALLRDERFPIPQRYLRKLYLDPITQRPGWGGYAAPDGGIMGVFSLSIERPFKTKNFPEIYKQFENKASYGEWIFAFTTQSEMLSPSQ